MKNAYPNRLLVSTCQFVFPKSSHNLKNSDSKKKKPENYWATCLFRRQHQLETEPSEDKGGLKNKTIV